MKIAMVSPYDFAQHGGVNAHILTLSDFLMLKGHEVKILAPSSKPPPEIGIDNLTPLGRPIAVPTAGSVARISFSLWLLPRIRALLDREAFDLIHYHEPYVPFVPLMILFNSRTTNVATFHAYELGRPILPFFKLPLRYWFNKLHGLIAVSPPVRNYLNQYLPGDYQVIPNSIDVQRFAGDVTPIAALMDGKLNILFVGRMERRKGLRYLLVAYSRLKRRHPNLRLIVIGRGKLDRESRRILRNEAPEDVLLCGRVSESDLHRYYRSAHIFCSPATGKESQGIVLLEAMAAARPVVASQIEGYEHVVEHGKNGLLVEPRNVSALEQTLELLIQDPQLRDGLAQGASARAWDYDHTRVARAVMEVYGKAQERATVLATANI
jgi:phosphatidylinositol alpha-mannosyltransferase